MPFYEYECASCRFYTELLQKVSDPPLRKCPSCGRSTMKKLVSAPNFRLKGGGWYETDFKSDKEEKRNLAVEKEPQAKPAAETKSEPKPAEAKAAESAESTATEPKESKGDGKLTGSRKPPAPARKPAPTKSRTRKTAAKRRPRR